MTITADDILFQPIASTKGLLIDQQMVDAVKIALSGVACIEFFVDSGIDFCTYEMIADEIENDQKVINYTQALVKSDPKPSLRPANALTIKDVFHHLYIGENTFWYCGRSNGNGVQTLNFSNWFAVENGLPVLGLDGGTAGFFNLFEWWIIGLMSKFVGYGEYYAFASEKDALKYYSIP